MSDEEYMPNADDIQEQFVNGSMMSGFAYSRNEASEVWAEWLAAHDHEVRVAYEELRKPNPILIQNIDSQHAGAWLAAHDREVAAKAWDEGLGAGRDRWMDHREFGDPPVNPYAALVSEPSTPEGETP